MFTFLFIHKHKKNVQRYIRLVYDPSQQPSEKRRSGVRFSVDLDSLNYSNESRTDRGGNTDNFDPDAVATAMSGYLQDSNSVNTFECVTNQTFAQKLAEHIKNKNLVAADVYKCAFLDRRLYSKIICNIDYKPSKDTALALIIALKLSLSEANDMLERAGYTLSHSIKRDIIIEYFLKENIYNLKRINDFLFDMNEKMIGRIF